MRCSAQGSKGGSGEFHTIFFDDMGNFHFNFFLQFIWLCLCNVDILEFCSFGVVRKIQSSGPLSRLPQVYKDTYIDATYVQYMNFSGIYIRGIIDNDQNIRMIKLCAAIKIMFSKNGH